MAEPETSAALTALRGFLDAFRGGRIVDLRAEREAFERHARALHERWDRRFPGFPREDFPYTSLRGEWHRGRRDAYLKTLVVSLLGMRSAGTIANPACVFGRHARDLARRLPRFRVVATDIAEHWNGWWKLFHGGRSPSNFEFRRDDVFEPRLDVEPTAVVFFGACGAVTDGAIDYAIGSGAQYLLCRTCCHDNIGGNTRVAPRSTYLGRFFRLKNRVLEWMRGREAYAGFYFSDRYASSAYPRSLAAGAVTGSAELLEVARHSPESDVCRAIIDLDRHLYLQERGFDVWYQGELFVAERLRTLPVDPDPARTRVPQGVARPLQ